MKDFATAFTILGIMAMVTACNVLIHQSNTERSIIRMQICDRHDGHVRNGWNGPYCEVIK